MQVEQCALALVSVRIQQPIGLAIALIGSLEVALFLIGDPETPVCASQRCPIVLLLADREGLLEADDRIVEMP
jgi:hypothetical protein